MHSEDAHASDNAVGGHSDDGDRTARRKNGSIGECSANEKGGDQLRRKDLLMSQILNYLSVTLIVSVVYALLYLSIGDAFLPTGSAWSLYIIWVCSHFGAIVAGMCRLPPLLGMLLSGVLLKNLPIDLVEGLPKSWSSGVRAIGLSIILMRSGLELDYEAIKRIGWMAGRLTCMPGMSEAFVSGIVAHGLFNMPITLAFSLGFILAAVSPAVVVIGMFDLGKRGYGVSKGVPSLVVAAASFDDVVAITGYSIFIGLALTEGPLYMSLLHGPIEILSGIFSGVIAGFIASATVLWTDRPKRSAIVLVMGLAMMFLGKHFHFQSAGAMAGLVMGIVTGVTWTKGYPTSVSIGANGHFAHEVESDLAQCWYWIAQPLLFGVIGAAVDFRIIETSSIPKCAVVILVGLVVRLPAAFAAVHGKDYTLLEKLFVAFSWMPKATVQAALASAPLDLIEDKTFGSAQEKRDYEQWGNVMLTTAVLSIIMTAPAGAIFINKMGPRWLTREGDVVPRTRNRSRSRGRSISTSDNNNGDSTRRGGLEGRKTRDDNGDRGYHRGVSDEEIDLEMIGLDRRSFPLFKHRTSFNGNNSLRDFSISSLSYRTLLQLGAAQDFLEKVADNNSRGADAEIDTTSASSHASFLQSLLNSLSFLKSRQQETGKLRSLTAMLAEQQERSARLSADDNERCGARARRGRGVSIGSSDGDTDEDSEHRKSRFDKYRCDSV